MPCTVSCTHAAPVGLLSHRVRGEAVLLRQLVHQGSHGGAHGRQRAALAGGITQERSQLALDAGEPLGVLLRGGDERRGVRRRAVLVP